MTQCSQNSGARSLVQTAITRCRSGSPSIGETTLHRLKTWEFVGRSPIENRRFPLVDSQWKFELAGYATVERATLSRLTPWPCHSIEQQCQRAPGHGARRVSYTSNPKYQAGRGSTGLRVTKPSPVSLCTDFWIDKFEVTNAQFKKFMDQGGYQNQGVLEAAVPQGWPRPSLDLRQ